MLVVALTAAGKLVITRNPRSGLSHLGAVVDKCVALTVPTLMDRLDGVASLTATHCHQFVITLRVD